MRPVSRLTGSVENTAQPEVTNELSADRPLPRLFRSHNNVLIDYASGIVGSRSEAEDVVQEAWLRFERAERARPVHEPVRYLYRIVRNLAIDGRRKLGRISRRSL